MSPSRVRKVIVSQGGTPDPNQQYERMILYNDDGSNYEQPEATPPIDPVPAEPDDDGYLQDHLGSLWCLVDADKATQITIKGKCHANANGDLGRMVLLVTGDNGSTAEELDTLATISSTDVDFSLSGIIPAGYEVKCTWLQNAPGEGGSWNFQKIILQPLN